MAILHRVTARVRSPAFSPAWLSHGFFSASLLAQQVLLLPNTGPARDWPNVRKAHARLTCMVCPTLTGMYGSCCINKNWFIQLQMVLLSNDPVNHRENGRNSSKVMELLLLSLSHPSASPTLYLSKETAEHIKPANAVLIYNWSRPDKTSNDQTVWGVPALLLKCWMCILGNQGGNLTSHYRCPTHFSSSSCFSL